MSGARRRWGWAFLAALTLLAPCVTLAACGGSSGGEDSGVTTAATAPPNQPGKPSGQSGKPSGQSGKPGKSESRGDAPGKGGDRSSGGGSASRHQPLATDPKRIRGAIVTRTGAVQTLPPSTASQAEAMKNSYSSIKAYGEETTGTEATEITFALVQYLTAQSQDDWGTACARLYSVLRERLAKLAEQSTDPSLRGAGCPQVLAALAKRGAQSPPGAARLDVASVRSDGERAFVIYKTPEVLSADMPMYRENGVWTVGALSAYVLTPAQAAAAG